MKDGSSVLDTDLLVDDENDDPDKQIQDAHTKRRLEERLEKQRQEQVTPALYPSATAIGSASGSADRSLGFWVG